MFFLIILLILVFILFSTIKVYICKKESLYHIRVKINFITLINKRINKSDKNKIKNTLKPWIKIKNIKSYLKEIWIIFIELNKKIEMEKMNLDISLSNNDYIKLSYYIGILNTIQYMLKNIYNKLDFNYKYFSQKESIKINVEINFKFKLYNNIINLIKMAIIIFRISKKGKMKNGTTSNRKFNGNCNVIY